MTRKMIAGLYASDNLVASSHDKIRKRIGNLFLKGQEGNEDASSYRGLESAGQETRDRVASEGGKAAHEQEQDMSGIARKQRQQGKGGENSRGGGR